jgi:hypothetical protein
MVTPATAPPPPPAPTFAQITSVPIIGTVLAFIAAGAFAYFVFQENEGNAELKRLSHEVQCV